MTKAKNSLLSLACGDAYGNAYEMQGLSGSVFTMEDLPKRAKIKHYTDDTKMSMILWMHYSNYGFIDKEKLMASYREWAVKDGLADGIGLHTYKVLVEGKTDKNSQGNGTVMRVIPFANRLIEEGKPFEEVLQWMNIDATLTHDNSIIKAANHLALDLSIHGLKTLKDAKHSFIVAQLKPGHTAWIVHTLHHVIEVLKMNIGMLDAFKELVSRGGDTDTNCAIYAAIKGYSDCFELTLEDFLDAPSIKILQYVLSSER